MLTEFTPAPLPMATAEIGVKQYVARRRAADLDAIGPLDFGENQFEPRPPLFPAPQMSEL